MEIIQRVNLKGLGRSLMNIKDLNSKLKLNSASSFGISLLLENNKKKEELFLTKEEVFNLYCQLDDYFEEERLKIKNKL